MNRLRLFVTFVCTTVPLAIRAEPLKVYILAGQSNMQGHAQIRTIEHLALDPASKPMLDEMVNTDGTPKVCERVWITSLGTAETEQVGKLTIGFGASQNGPKIGPEFTFGLTIQKQIKNPILLIKTSWGGKSLHTDFRPPSAGPYEFNQTQLVQLQKQGKDIAAVKAEKAAATGVNYQLMIQHVRSVLADIRRVVPSYDATQGYELAGFVWFQGWNDMVDSGAYPQREQPWGYDDYSHTLAHLIRDVRKDLSTPNLPFVIGVLGVGGPIEKYDSEQQRYATIHSNFRNAMAAPAGFPEFQGNVIAVRTEKYWDGELSAAKAKEDRLRQQAKKIATDRKLNSDEEKAILAELLAKGLSEREQLILAKGVSNLEFHYLGSAKILGGIGQGLAEAVLQINSRPLER